MEELLDTQHRAAHGGSKPKEQCSLGLALGPEKNSNFMSAKAETLSLKPHETLNYKP